MEKRPEINFFEDCVLILFVTQNLRHSWKEFSEICGKKFDYRDSCERNYVLLFANFIWKNR